MPLISFNVKLKNIMINPYIFPMLNDILTYPLS